MAAHQHERAQTEQVNRTTDRVNRLAELTKKQRDGSMSADESAEFAGMTGPAGGTLSDTAKQVREIEQAIRAQGGRGNAQQEAVLQQLYERLIGASEQENLPGQQRGDVQDAEGRISRDLANSAIARGKQGLQDLAGAGVVAGGSATPAQLQQLIDMQHKFADMVIALHLSGTDAGNELSALTQRIQDLESRLHTAL